jgi:hypothetical protein
MVREAVGEFLKETREWWIFRAYEVKSELGNRLGMQRCLHARIKRRKNCLEMLEDNKVMEQKGFN